MKDKKISSKDLFILSESDINPNPRDAILEATKKGDMVTIEALISYTSLPYSSVYSNMVQLTTEGHFENLGIKYVPQSNGIRRRKSSVYRRLTNSS